MNHLVPKNPKRKRQPSAAVMRQQLALAADEIIRLRSAYQDLWTAFYSPAESLKRLDAYMKQTIPRKPWWRLALQRIREYTHA